MFAKPTYTVGNLQRVVATLVACSVVATSFGVYSTAQAANLNLISDTLSDSAPSVVSAHTIAFTIPAGRVLDVAETITIDFSDGPFTDVNTLVGGDVTVTVNGTPDAHANFAAGASSISFDSIAASAGQEVVVAIADGNIVNPAGIQSYEIVVQAGAGANGDTGRTRVAIVDTVEVTAIVETTFDFLISGTGTSTSVNGTSTTGSTTATQIPFGVLTAGQIKTLAQRLNVTTNAANGFAVTVEQDSDLISSTGSNIDSFINGSYLNVPGAWTSPGGTLGNVNEYGHWGLTSSDGNLQGLGNAFGVNQWIAASTTPRVVMAHDGVADGSFGSDTAAGDDIGETLIGYQIEITSLQEAADDYNTTLTYIATPTF